MMESWKLNYADLDLFEKSRILTSPKSRAGMSKTTRGKIRGWERRLGEAERS